VNTWHVGSPRSRTFAIAASGSLPMSTISPSRSGFFPALTSLACGVLEPAATLSVFALTVAAVGAVVMPIASAPAAVCKNSRLFRLFIFPRTVTLPSA
jgi:hypothetical protein